ncbi:MAG: tautomerase family protein [Acetobacteraceae bacterium]
MLGARRIDRRQVLARKLSSGKDAAVKTDVVDRAQVQALVDRAVRALSEGLRQEVKPYNIRTTVISPCGDLARRSCNRTAKQHHRPGHGRTGSQIHRRGRHRCGLLRACRGVRHQPAGGRERQRDPVQADAAGTVSSKEEMVPHVIVKLLTGRTEQQKVRIAGEVTKAVMATTGVTERTLDRQGVCTQGAIAVTPRVDSRRLRLQSAQSISAPSATD